MHFYKKNIGDYAKKTGRLTILQHGAYTLLMDACYDRERFPTLEEAIEWTWALSDEEVAAVEFVLKRFFTLEDGFYVQNRIREEIIEYNGKSLKNKEIAIEREAKRKQESTERARTVNESPPNHKPLTNNHKPIIKNKAKSQPDKPSDVSDSVWQDFLQIRKAKRSPMTDTALQQIRAEAEKANITLQTALEHSCARGWQGFKAEWLIESTTQRASAANGETAYQRSMREKWEEATGQKASDHLNIIDITPTQSEKLRIA